MASTNPITRIEEALWELLEANADFIKLVPAGNRIKTTEPLLPMAEKEVAQHADKPEVRIIVAGGAMRPDNDSSQSHFKRVFALQVSTADQYRKTVDDVEWQIFRSIAYGWRTKLDGLTWTSKRYACHMRPADVKEDLESDRSIKGWQTVAMLPVDLFFDTADLAPTAPT